MTNEETRNIVAILAATWTRPPVSEATVHAYCFALADLDHDAAKAAVLSLMQTAKFFPTISEIRERAIKRRVALPSPEEAWGIVRRAIGTLGSYRIPVFDSDEIQAAVDAIGWRSICTDENEAATRARFCAVMSSMTARRLELEATGRYTPPDRMLPANTTPLSGQGDPHVRVTTGYGTVRPQLLALQASDEERALRAAEARDAYLTAYTEVRPPLEPDVDEGGTAVVSMADFLAKHPSSRGTP